MRMTPTRLVLHATERHSLINYHVIAYDGGFTDYDPGAVVNEQTLTDFGRWMYPDTGQHTCKLAYELGCKLVFVYPQLVRPTMQPYRVKA